MDGGSKVSMIVGSSSGVESATAASEDAPTDAKRWALVVERAVDSSFVYAVTTTGIYCRSHCASRRALRKNVRFFDTPIAAEIVGFRACKRCQPEQGNPTDAAARSVAQMCMLLEERDAEPSLAELAECTKLSPSHAHRLFSRLIGLTPKGYRTAVLRRRVQARLAQQNSVTGTIYEAGFGASSRFYERAVHLLGMSPSQYRAGAPEQQVRFAVGECSLGSFLVAATERGVCAVYLGEQPESLVAALEERFSAAMLIGADKIFEKTVAQVVTAIERQSSAQAAGLPVDVRGTAFQERVYRALGQIPRGSTVSYTELARMIGAPKAARAVASACARNELAILVPCHRVVRSDGSLSGYRWGVERKRELLEREQQDHPTNRG